MSNHEKSTYLIQPMVDVLFVYSTLTAFCMNYVCFRLLQFRRLTVIVRELIQDKY